MTTPTPVKSRRSPESLALTGLIINALLAAGKALAGILGNSFAMVADAAESMVDIAGSLVIWGALRYGGRPPDETHPFGHGKAEALGALTVALIVAIVGVFVAVHAVHGIRTPQPVPAPWTLIVIVGVVAIKETMFRVARRAARHAGSNAGLADAWHHRSDAITSLAAFIGIAIAVIGGPKYAAADDWAALAAAGVILINAWLIAREPFHELLDRSLDDVAERCTQIALTVPGVRGIERCNARQSGRAYRVTMHAEVDPAMSVADAHTLTGKVKAAVREQIPRVESLLIHVEPFTLD